MSKNKREKKLRILGLDPGTATTGWGIVEVKENSPSLCAYGLIETAQHKKPSERLREIASDLEAIILKYNPNEVAIEDLFFFKNVKTAIKVAQARGVLILICCQKRIPVFEYTPLEVKQALTGYGRADKRQVQLMVKSVLKIKNIPRPDDAADALAVALCHQQSRKIMLAQQE